MFCAHESEHVQWEPWKALEQGGPAFDGVFLQSARDRAWPKEEEQGVRHGTGSCLTEKVGHCVSRPSIPPSSPAPWTPRMPASGDCLSPAALPPSSWVQPTGVVSPISLVETLPHGAEGLTEERVTAQCLTGPKCRHAPRSGPQPR